MTLMVNLTIYLQLKVSQQHQYKLTINQKPLTMKLDTGASYSLISEHIYQSMWSEKDGSVLQESSVKVHTYTGEQVAVVLSLFIVIIKL